MKTVALTLILFNRFSLMWDEIGWAGIIGIGVVFVVVPIQSKLKLILST